MTQSLKGTGHGGTKPVSGSGSFSEAARARAEAEERARRAAQERARRRQEEAAREAAEKRRQEQEEKEGGVLQGLWNKAKDLGKGAVDKVKDVAKKADHAAGAMVDGWVQGAKETKDLLGKAESKVVHEAGEAGEALVEGGKQFAEDWVDGVGIIGETVGDKVKDLTLGKLAMDGPDQFHDQGDLSGITSKLGVGDSVSVKISAGATIPLEEVYAPDAKLDAGGTLTIKRVPKLGADGKPLREPRDADGNPPSLIRATVTLEGRAGGAYEAKIGVSATTKVGDYEVGAKGTAGAGAEAGLQGKVAYSFDFDPKSAEDMRVFTGMAKVTAEAGIAEAVGGPVLAGLAVGSQKDLVGDFGRHLSEVQGEGGLYGQVTANASAKIGIFQTAPGSEASGNGSAAAAKGFALDKLKFNLASAAASAGGGAVVGGILDFKTGQATLYARLEGEASASASVLATGKGAAAARGRTVAFTYDPDGSLAGVKVIDEMTKSRFKGLQNTVEDVYGRPLDEGAIAKIGHADKVKISYEMKPLEVAKIDRDMKQGLTGQALAYLRTLQVGKDNARLDKRSIVADHADSLSLKIDLNVALGAEIGIRGGAEIEHVDETSLTT